MPEPLYLPRRRLITPAPAGNLGPFGRRTFLGTLGSAVLAHPFFTTPGLFAEELFATPRMTEGPFYPDQLPLDQDNDLIILSNSTTPAIGEVTNLTGRVLTSSGEPVSGAVVEIWQCDANQVYLHTNDSSRKQSQQDKHFQGFGRFTTDSAGRYRFRTIKPVPYPGRPAPHIHFKVKRNDREVLTTQLMIRNHPGNRQDGIFSRDLVDRELIQTDFTPVPDSKVGELAASWDIVLGRTPDDRTSGGPPRG